LIGDGSDAPTGTPSYLKKSTSTIEKEDPELKNDPVALALNLRLKAGSLAEVISESEATK